MIGRLKPPVGDGDHIDGPDDAMVTLVEFGDYECPYCGQAYYVVKALQQQLGERLRFVFRNFPLASAHPHAVLAAEAAEAAGAQERFWQMHDALYEHQEALELEYILGYATNIGVDEDRLAADLRSHRFDGKLRADIRSGAVSGVNVTPTFFVDGRRHDGASTSTLCGPRSQARPARSQSRASKG
jgi:protein-disulfide isomerase